MVAVDGWDIEAVVMADPLEGFDRPSSGVALDAVVDASVDC